jgi:hypothetical protein
MKRKHEHVNNDNKSDINNEHVTKKPRTEGVTRLLDDTEHIEKKIPIVKNEVKQLEQNMCSIQKQIDALTREKQSQKVKRDKGTTFLLNLNFIYALRKLSTDDWINIGKYIECGSSAYRNLCLVSKSFYQFFSLKQFPYEFMFISLSKVSSDGLFGFYDSIVDKSEIKQVYFAFVDNDYPDMILPMKHVTRVVLENACDEYELNIGADRILSLFPNIKTLVVIEDSSTQSKNHERILEYYAKHGIILIVCVDDSDCEDGHDICIYSPSYIDTGNGQERLLVGGFFPELKRLLKYRICKDQQHTWSFKYKNVLV